METICSIIAIVISVLSGAFSIGTFIWTVHRDKKQATLDAYNVLQEQALDHLNHYLPSRTEELAKNPGSEEYKTVSAYIARVEHFCVGVNKGVYDAGVVYELAEGYLDGVIKRRIEPIINRKNKVGNMDYYENIHKFYAKMEKRKKRQEKRRASSADKRVAAE